MFVAAGKSENQAGVIFRREPNFPFWTLSCLISGKVIIRHAEVKLLIEAGQLAVVEPDTPYQYEVIEAVQEIYAFFLPRQEIEQVLGWPMPTKGVRLLKFADSIHAGGIEEACEEIFRLANEPFPNRRLFAENALEKVLLLSDLINPNRFHARWDDRLQSAIRFIDSHLQCELTVARLAREANLSPSRFAHLFRAQIEMGPMEYVERRRLSEAQRLLMYTNKAICEIAEACGFRNPFHFSTRFKKFSGQAPSEYRRNPQIPGTPVPMDKILNAKNE